MHEESTKKSPGSFSGSRFSIFAIVKALGPLAEKFQHNGVSKPAIQGSRMTSPRKQLARVRQQRIRCRSHSQPTNVCLLRRITCDTQPALDTRFCSRS